MSSPLAPIKVCLVGDAGVGKTTFARRHRTGEFEPKYIATMGVEVNRLSFLTTAGAITFNIWDCAGQEKYGGLRTDYWTGCNLFIVMFDVTSKVTYKNVDLWIQWILKLNPQAKIVLCGNKVDRRDRRVMPADILLHRKYQIPYFDISAKNNYNFEKPFLTLIRFAFKKENIFFVEAPSAILPVVFSLP